MNASNIVMYFVVVTYTVTLAVTQLRYVVDLLLSACKHVNHMVGFARFRYILGSKQA